MITLLTGAPGAGKTAQLVEWLRTLYADRPLYVHGLNGLKLGAKRAPPPPGPRGNHCDGGPLGKDGVTFESIEICCG